MHYDGSALAITICLLLLHVFLAIGLHLLVVVLEMFEQISIGPDTMDSDWPIESQSHLELFDEEVGLNFLGAGLEGGSPEVQSNLSHATEGTVCDHCFEGGLPIWVVFFEMKKAGVYAEGGDDSYFPLHHFCFLCVFDFGYFL